jgi:hypothetical protein
VAGGSELDSLIVETMRERSEPRSHSGGVVFVSAGVKELTICVS